MATPDKAYVLVDITILEQEGFMEYVGKIPALIEKHGGRYLVRGEPPEVILASSEHPQFVVVLEFPNKESAMAFLAERSESGLAELFARSTRGRILLADGVSEADEAPA